MDGRHLHFFDSSFLLFSPWCRGYAKVTFDVGLDAVIAWMILVAFHFALETTQTRESFRKLAVSLVQRVCLRLSLSVRHTSEGHWSRSECRCYIKCIGADLRSCCLDRTELEGGDPDLPPDLQGTRLSFSRYRVVIIRIHYMSVFRQL